MHSLQAVQTFDSSLPLSLSIPQYKVQRECIAGTLSRNYLREHYVLLLFLHRWRQLLCVQMEYRMHV